jgi:hypothetical protein
MSCKPIEWKVSIWILAAPITTGTTRVYYIQEMLAALILFSVLFASVAATVLILFLIWLLLDRASQLAWGWIEAPAKSIGRAALHLLPARSGG